MNLYGHKMFYTFSVKIFPTGKIEFHYYDLYTHQDLNDMNITTPTLSDGSKAYVSVVRPNKFVLIQENAFTTGVTDYKYPFSGYFTPITGFQSNRTITYCNIPNILCITPYYVPMSGGNITLSGDYMGCDNIQFAYVFKGNRIYCSVISNTSFTCRVPPTYDYSLLNKKSVITLYYSFPYRALEILSLKKNVYFMYSNNISNSCDGIYIIYYRRYGYGM